MKEEILNKTTLRKHEGYFYFMLEKEEQGKNNLIRNKFNKK